jgi:endonuclease/exonuclease/phosphatase family metal-dependent hydrolase
MLCVVCSPIRACRTIRTIALLIAIISFAAAAAAQTTVTLSTPGAQINADLTIQGGASATTDFSGTDTLGSKTSSSADYQRHILLKFDTANFIPQGAVVTSAKLQLVLKGSASSETRPFTAYYVTKSFHSGDTNWLYYDNGMAWSTPGGDLGASFGTTQVGDAEGWTYTFDLTQLVSKVVSGAYGSRYTRMALIDTGGISTGSSKDFYSTRATNSAVRPKLVITYTTSTPTPPPPNISGGSGTTLRVMQWNIHKTKNSNGVCDPNFTVDTIAKMKPDVVSLNELNYFSGVCGWGFDMAERLRSMLQQKTGVTWYGVQDHTSTQPRDAIFSQFPLVSASSTGLSYDRGVVHVGVVVNGRTVNLFSTHIEWDNASYRPIQINEAIRYLSTFAEPRILMGDFNTWPNTADYSLLATPYQDGWTAALKAGTATSYNGTGATHGDSRFDYVFFTRSSSLVLNSVNVPNTKVNGVWPSDHDPVVAVFSVK